MRNISDTIEQFILDTIGDEKSMLISRNELAQFFGCVPSQINYVLSTRFTVDKGFTVDSKRGGGGYVTLLKLDMEENFINELLKTSIGNDITAQRSIQILDRLIANDIITEREKNIIKEMTSDKAIVSYDRLSKDVIRAGLFKSFLICLLKDDDKEKTL